MIVLVLFEKTYGLEPAAGSSIPDPHLGKNFKKCSISEPK